MPASTYNAILDAVQSTVGDLSLLDWNNNVVPSAVRKVPKREEDNDPTPLIVVYPAAPEAVENAATNGTVFVTYKVGVAVLAGGNADYTTHLATYLGWRESLRRAFQRYTAPSVPTLWRVLVQPEDVLKQTLLDANYDFALLTVLLETCEPAV